MHAQWNEGHVSFRMLSPARCLRGSYECERNVCGAAFAILTVAGRSGNLLQVPHGVLARFEATVVSGNILAN
eukprot:6178415-Pleurochrysis_carterae.AAC.2